MEFFQDVQGEQLARERREIHLLDGQELDVADSIGVLAGRRVGSVHLVGVFEIDHRRIPETRPRRKSESQSFQVPWRWVQGAAVEGLEREDAELRNGRAA